MTIAVDTEPFFTLLGFHPEEVRPDFCRMRMPFKPELQQAGGLVHGGAIASLMDSAAVFAINATVDPEATQVPTISMTVNYLAPAQQIDLIAEARVIRRGRSIVFSDVEVLAPDNSLIAKAQIVCKLTAAKKSRAN